MLQFLLNIIIEGRNRHTEKSLNNQSGRENQIGDVSCVHIYIKLFSIPVEKRLELVSEPYPVAFDFDIPAFMLDSTA